MLLVTRTGAAGIAIAVVRVGVVVVVVCAQGIVF
jgi:hypothetical protein